MTRFVLAAALVFALAACATTPVSGPSAPSGTAHIPSSPVELGDYRSATEAATRATFEQAIAARYGAGLAVSAAAADLGRNDFRCGEAPALDHGRGDPPAQVCRRTITQSGCTHTWQAHLFDGHGDGRLARTRGLYDRRCGGDGLLGGPS